MRHSSEGPVETRCTQVILNGMLKIEYTWEQCSRCPCPTSTYWLRPSTSLVPPSYHPCSTLVPLLYYPSAPRLTPCPVPLRHNCVTMVKRVGTPTRSERVPHPVQRWSCTRWVVVRKLSGTCSVPCKSILRRQLWRRLSAARHVQTCQVSC